MMSRKVKDRKVAVSFTNWVLGGSLLSVTSTDSERRHQRVSGRKVVFSDIDSNDDEIVVKEAENPKIEKSKKKDESKKEEAKKDGDNEKYKSKEKQKKKCKQCGHDKDCGKEGKREDGDRSKKDDRDKAKKESGDKDKKDSGDGEKNSNESKEKSDKSSNGGSDGWTDEQISKLREMKVANKSWKEISAELNIPNQKQLKDKFKELQKAGTDKPDSGGGSDWENAETVTADSGAQSSCWENAGTAADPGTTSNGWNDGGGEWGKSNDEVADSSGTGNDWNNTGGDWNNGGDTVPDTSGQFDSWKSGDKPAESADAGQSNGWNAVPMEEFGVNLFDDPEKSNDTTANDWNAPPPEPQNSKSTSNNNWEKGGGGKKQKGNKKGKEVHWNEGNNESQNTGGNEWKSDNAEQHQNSGGSGWPKSGSNEWKSDNTEQYQNSGGSTWHKLASGNEKQSIPGGWPEDSNIPWKLQAQESGPQGGLQPDNFWTKNDCEILEHVWGEYKEYEWLHVKARFFNYTQRMVSEEMIKKKFRDDGLI